MRTIVKIFILACLEEIFILQNFSDFYDFHGNEIKSIFVEKITVKLENF